MTDNQKIPRHKRIKHSAPDGGIYLFVAFIGAAVYFVQQASGIGEIIIALLKAVIWPALLVYELLSFLQV